MKKLFEPDADFKSETKMEFCEKHGQFKSDSFNPLGRTILWTRCPECESEEKAAQEQKRIDEHNAREERIRVDDLSNMEIPRRYWNIKLTDYKPNQNQVQAHSKAVYFAENFSTDKSQVLILAGTTGTGKTMLASALMQTLWQGLYIRAIDISRLVRSTYSGNDKTEKDVVDGIVNIPLLVIDEVGVQSGSENESILITDIIDRRYAELKSTVIVSNLNPSSLAKVFGERAWDRIRQDAVYEEMTGESQRRNKND